MVGKQVFSTSRDYWDDIRREGISCCVELSAPADMVAVIVTLIALREYFFALASNLFSSNRPRLVIFCDEASLLFGRDRQQALGALPYVLDGGHLAAVAVLRARPLGTRHAVGRCDGAPSR